VPVAGSCEYGDGPWVSGATDLASKIIFIEEYPANYLWRFSLRSFRQPAVISRTSSRSQNYGLPLPLSRNYLHLTVLEMGRYTIPELLFVPELHTGTYQYILYQFIFFRF
jgi:hypothetical protein